MSLGLCVKCKRFSRGDICSCGGAVVRKPIPEGRRDRLGRAVMAGALVVSGTGCLINAQPLYGAVCISEAGCDPVFDSGVVDGSKDAANDGGMEADVTSDAPSDSASDAPSSD